MGGSREALADRNFVLGGTKCSKGRLWILAVQKRRAAVNIWARHKARGDLQGFVQDAFSSHGLDRARRFIVLARGFRAGGMPLYGCWKFLIVAGLFGQSVTSSMSK